MWDDLRQKAVVGNLICIVGWWYCGKDSSNQCHNLGFDYYYYYYLLDNPKYVFYFVSHPWTITLTRPSLVIFLFFSIFQTRVEI